MRQTKAAAVLILVLWLVGGCARTGQHRLIVLPFENLSARPEDDWLRDAFSESLNDHLNYVESVHVVSREELNNACRDMKLAPYVPFEEASVASRIGKRLESTDVLIGSFRRRDNHLVVFSRLVNVRRGEVVHAYRQQQEALQNFLFFTQVKEIAGGFLPALGVSKSKVEDVEDKIAQAGRRAAKLKVFEYFVLGRLASFKGTEEDYRVATTWFDEAIKADYRYALAYVGRAEALTLWGFLVKQNNRPYQEFYRKAHEALARARQYDPKLPAFHRRPFERILEADIDYIVGETHLRNRQYNEAIAAFRKSLERTPADVMTLYRIGEAYLGLGETQRARHHFVSALEKNPSFVPAIDRLESLMQQ